MLAEDATADLAAPAAFRGRTGTSASPPPPPAWSERETSPPQAFSFLKSLLEEERVILVAFSPDGTCPMM